MGVIVFPQVQDGAQWFVSRVVKFILEYLAVLATQQKQPQQHCIINCMHFRSLPCEHSGKNSIRDLNKYQIFANRMRIWIFKPKIRTSFNIPNY